MKTEEDVAGLNLVIDENNLLNEWKGQAQMMLDYGIKLADAMQEEDEASGAFDVLKAKVETAIRADPEAYGVGKATEASVAACVLVQPKYMEADALRIKASHAVRILRAAVDAISHRKSTLQGMTDLFLRQWYADPKSAEQPRELREAAAAGPPTKTIPGRKLRRREETER